MEASSDSLQSDEPASITGIEHFQKNVIAETNKKLELIFDKPKNAASIKSNPHLIYIDT